MELHITRADVITLLIAIIAAAVIITKLIDGLQKIKAVKDGQAHNWNQVLGLLSAAAIFGLKYLGADEATAVNAQALGIEIAAVFVTGFTIAVAAKMLHEVVKWIEGRQSIKGFLAR